MPLTMRCFPFLLSACAAAYCQDQPITFEVASVKISPPIDYTKPPNFGCNGGPGTTDPGLYVCRYATLQGLVIEAFGLASYQFPYVPSGDHTVYDIVAKVPAGATREQFRRMIQNLLAERLKLAYHYERKQAQVYDIAIAKNGPKLKVSPPESPGKPQPSGSPARDEYGFRIPPADFQGEVMERNGEIARWVARGITTGQMAKMLAGRLQRPVTDSTGLDGKYDFSLYFSSESVGMSPGPAPAGAAVRIRGTASGESLPSVFLVLHDKLGLTLEQKQGFFDLFVVDRVEKTPVEN
jgi:uncharacterized protein (TIGR03435 family)